MISKLNPQHIKYRDGLSQLARVSPELNPDNIKVDERRLEDFIHFARELAEHLNFYNEQNQQAGTWTGFLTHPLYQGREKEWFEDLAAFIENTEAFTENYPAAAQAFSSPHLALFIIFLKLLEKVQKQLNTFSKQHLDFYYHQLLGLSKRKPVPDVANVIVQLSPQVNQLLLPKDTALNAGKDMNGLDLLYRTQKETLITRAAIAGIKTLFVDTEKIKPASMGQGNPKETIKDLLSIALDYDTFDPLLFYDGKDINKTLLSETAAKYQLKTDELEDAVNYALAKPGTVSFYQVIQNLRQAYQRHKIHLQRLAIRDTLPLFALIGEIMGGENGMMPLFMEKRITKDVFLHLNNFFPNDDPPQQNQSEEQSRAALYIKRDLLLSFVDFKQLAVLIEKQKNITDADWVIAYEILAGVLEKKGKFYELPAFQHWYDIQAADVLNKHTNIADKTGPIALGKNEDAVQMRIVALGFAISSPHFALSEGERIINLQLKIQAGSPLKLARLKKELSETKQPPFRYLLGKGNDWKEITDSKAELLYDNFDVLRIRLNVSTQKTVDADQQLLPPSMRHIAADRPILALLLNHQSSKTGSEEVNGVERWYDYFQDMEIKEIKAEVSVKGLQLLRIQNDFAELSPQKPFEPFGVQPQAGNNFYFTHPELAAKSLNTLSLNFTWINKPASFENYYKDYQAVADKTAKGKDLTIDFGFKARVRMYTDHTPKVLVDKDINLFEDNTITLAKTDEELPMDVLDNRDDVVSQKRYFGLELLQDFNHGVYPILQTLQMVNYSNDELKKYILNPPYAPKLQRFTVDYTTTFTLGAETWGAPATIFRIGPFGYAKLSEGLLQPFSLLPVFKEQGHLYIGISGAQKNQNLSLLFQLAQATANPELTPPVLTWSFLRNNTWEPLPAACIVTDTTNNLTGNGIIEFSIPDEITDNNTLFQEGLYWLSATAHENVAALPAIVDIAAQAVATVFTDPGDAGEHYDAALPPGSIKKAQQDFAGIAKLNQPYPSEHGRPAEQDNMFYTRVSERIRHKNRALTLWDYERLVLENFPEVYKVKCIPVNTPAQNELSGAVDIVVVPDIRRNAAFNSFEPRASVNLLQRITAWLERRTPPFAEIKVRNAVYVKIRVKTLVSIKKGLSKEYYRQQLNTDLKKLFSPWAFDHDADLIIGGAVYQNVVVYFIAKLPYIDHVATLSLAQGTADGTYEDIKPMNTQNTDVILVSAPTHTIHLMEDDDVPLDPRVGIGYMEIALDFRVY
ncbi:Baseplate J-like protein [Mucilaginibacter mallensis]|uniref:Baseplate J-like protein n=1 Tax=Mucilaginibacter mallensis TaxID=652787 RepID=A0A1H1XTS2_MUCMA|nr:baseplate J/gp47 family protein [Mucilaginibacter mallensis]SDT12593.1 Baseplate J-like protein [Mucilaginibacter mallensis]